MNTNITTNQRRYQRIPGNGLLAGMETGALRGEKLLVKDISRSGVALQTDWQAASGQAVTLTIGGSFKPIHCRVVRCAPGTLVLTFRNEASNLATVDEAICRAARVLGLTNDQALGFLKELNPEPAAALSGRAKDEAPAQGLKSEDARRILTVAITATAGDFVTLRRSDALRIREFLRSSGL